MTIELLKRIFVVCRDFTGQLSEESLRRNFVLLYELLDEIMVCLLRGDNRAPYVYGSRRFRRFDMARRMNREQQLQ